jgi:transposase InsO family protein
LRAKGEVFDKFKEYKALVENQTGMKIKTFRSDNEGEFVSKKFDNFLHECGIQQQTSAPYTSQQMELRNEPIGPSWSALEA